MSKYSVGVDFGSLSVRAILINIDTGEEIANSVYEYPHAIMESALPTGEKLGENWALQHPGDYLEGLSETVRGVLRQAKVPKEDVIGIGVDFTACTILPVKADGMPLCFLEQYKNSPHAYAKLWKHHAAQYCADILNETAERLDQEWLSLYGGKVSSEWLVPKTMQIVLEAPEIYDAADRIIEAGDWIVWQLTGRESRSACFAGYKSLYHHKNGFPSKSFFKALHPKLENIVEEKLSGKIQPLGDCAGYVTEEMSEKTGLAKGTAVAVGIIDAHASVPASGIARPGRMLMIAGTSTCHMLLSEQEKGVPGVCGIVKDGILPGWFGYEAGQCCVGDHFAWFVEQCVPAAYMDEAKRQGKGIHQYLREKAQELNAGESGLIALDWWNGVRSVLMDANLSGMLLGMTLQTKPEEIYRALIEATAYGTRKIIDTFEESGVVVEELCAAGGIAAKDPMTMQIYADVCNREIKISDSAQSGAYGSAIFGIAAAGVERSGYQDIGEIVSKLGKIKEWSFRQDPHSAMIYDKLYEEYKVLHDYFGYGVNEVMKRLRKIKCY